MPIQIKIPTVPTVGILISFCEIMPLSLSHMPVRMPRLEPNSSAFQSARSRTRTWDLVIISDAL